MLPRGRGVEFGCGRGCHHRCRHGADWGPGREVVHGGGGVGPEEAQPVPNGAHARGVRGAEAARVLAAEQDTDRRARAVAGLVVHVEGRGRGSKSQISVKKPQIGVYGPDQSRYDGLCSLGPNCGFFTASIDFAPKGRFLGAVHRHSPIAVKIGFQSPSARS